MFFLQDNLKCILMQLINLLEKNMVYLRLK